MSEKKYRIVIADDSAIIRGLLEKAFSRESDFEIAASVSNGRKAVDFVRDNPVDAVVSDVDMPEMNGLESLKILTEEFNIPVAIFSENIANKNEALEKGALLFALKPPLSEFKIQNLEPLIKKLREKLSGRVTSSSQTSSPQISAKSDDFSIKEFAKDVSLTHKKIENQQEGEYKILCIGASTGGPSAVQAVLSGLDKDYPLPILYAQHIDTGSDSKMALWFKTVCPNIPFSLAEDGEVARPGHVYMAPADVHLVIDYINSQGLPVLKLSHEPEEHFLRPAVNKLFRSAAHFYKEGVLAVLMTGMGRDGAEGCQSIVKEGGFTIAEDESTCAVFGMPKAAIEMGAAKEVLRREKIAERLWELS